MKSRIWWAVCIAGLAMLFSSGAAHAYPDNGLTIDVDGTVCSGDRFPVTVDGGPNEADFVVNFNGKTRAGSDGTTFSTSFKAPKVTGSEDRLLTAEATYSDGTTAEASARVTISDCVDDAEAENGDNAGDNGLLPDTGGPQLWLLVIAGALLVVGGGVTALRGRA